MFKIIASLYLPVSLDNMNLRYEGPYAKKGKDSEERSARKILLGKEGKDSEEITARKGRKR